MVKIPVIIVFLLLTFALGVVNAVIGKKRLFRYWCRPCMGAEWHSAFPHVPKDDIRKFLNIFSDAFMFQKKHCLKFGPMDKVMDVYRTIYPRGGTVDNMELETFALAIEREYGVDFRKMWKPEETTLADAFQMTGLSLRVTGGAR